MATISINNGGLAVCQEALTLLRQDRDLPVSGSMLDASSDVVAKKVDRVYDSARALVIGAHGWDGLTLTDGDNEDIRNSWPKQIRAAFVAILARELALPVTGRQEDLKAMHELYAMKLAEAVKKDFEEAVSRETDKLALAVYAVCRGYLKDGEPPPWGWAGFKARVGNAKAAALLEVKNAHGWSTEFAGADTDWRYPAYERLVTAKMAASVGAGVEQQNLMFQAYRKALEEAVAKDWRQGISAEQDPIVREAFLGIQERANGGGQKDWSYGRMREVVLQLKDRVRKEVLEERDWNFARRSMDVMATEDRYQRWSAALPHDCLKIHDVEDCDGMSVARDGWWIEDGFLKVHGRAPARIAYTADMRNVELWDPVAREAYFTLLMCRLVKATPEIGVRAQLLNGEYLELIRKAALKDAKETQPGRVCWGPNDYADEIRGLRGLRGSRGSRGCGGGFVR